MTVTPLAAHQVLLLLLQLALLLALALGLGRIARSLGMPAVVGELLTGVLLGPSLLGWAAPGLTGWLLPAETSQAHLLDAVGLLGVLLLVGVTGMQLDLRLIRRRAGVISKVGACGLVIPFALGLAAGYLLPDVLIGSGADRITFALFLGVAMCLSAIPVITKTLSDMNLLHRDVGQLTVAAATVDDVVGWLLLSLVSAMAVSSLHLGEVVRAIAYLLGFILFAVLIARPVVWWLMNRAARSDDAASTLATAVVIVLGCATGSHALGLEAVFGAFVGGILIGTVPGLNAARLAPLRVVVLSVLAPIFLATAGLRIDLTALAELPVLLSALAVLSIAVFGKLAGAYLGARLARMGHWEGLALGAGLNARGVIEVIVALVGLRLGVLTPATYTIVVLVAVFTSVMAPPLLKWAMARVEQGAQERLREVAMAAWEIADAAPGPHTSRS